MQIVGLLGCVIFWVISLVPAPLRAADAGDGWQRDKKVEWRAVGALDLPARPLDVVHSPDGRRVYCLTEAHRVMIYSAGGTLLGTIPVDKGVRSLTISPNGEGLFLADAEGKKIQVLELGYVVSVNTAGSPSLGPDKTPVEIVIFTDFECPFCAKAAPLLEEIHRKNPKNVRIVFKNLPLKFHRLAEPAALAGLAAHLQGKFWPMHDQLFGGGKLEPRLIEEAARKVGLDMERFHRDLNDQEVRQRLARDLYDAQEAGVNSTPTILVNGRVVRNRSVEVIQRMIDEELASPTR